MLSAKGLILNLIIGLIIVSSNAQDVLQCYTCTSLDDPLCESWPERKQPCDSEYCITALSGNITVRGCRSEIMCDATDSTTCRLCSATDCNAIDLRNRVDDGYHGFWQELPLRCHRCTGEQCRHDLEPAQSCSGSNIEQDCMTVFDAAGNVTQRGCSEEVENYNDRYCRQNPGKCQICKSNECNSAANLNNYVDCSYCDSSKNAACAIAPATGSFEKRSCYKGCMTALKDGHVIRSCLDDKELLAQQNCVNNPNSKDCLSCEGANCNLMQFPADRMSCHVCSGVGCASSQSQYCELYSENDFCFAKYEAGKADLLGCVSSQSASNIASWTNANKLYRCSGNDCNDLTKLPGSCISCDSKTNPLCAQNPSAIRTTSECGSQRFECAVYVGTDGNTLRSCIEDLPQASTCAAAGTCAICSGFNCNTQIFPTNRARCHICNSNENENCADAPSALAVCPIYNSNERCVSRNIEGLIERGCESSFTCNTDDSKYCQICTGDGCNTHNVNGAGSLAASASIVISLLVVAVSLLK